MNLEFKKIILHNFLSYQHAELILDNRGQCLVSGENHYSKDMALSNGSGKSSLWSGISWALTGRTLAGITTEVKNLNVSENSCYVQLEFNADKNNFIVIRSREPKPLLKVFVNNIDISGKGLKESEAVLATQLPDLTGDLLSSVILFGQSLPNRLSSRTPVGRKELLEKLAKTDFMIEEIKAKISSRQGELEKSLREVEDASLKLTTEKNLFLQQLAAEQNNYNLFLSKNYTAELEELTAQKIILQETVDGLLAASIGAEKEVEETTILLSELNNKKQIKQNTISSDYNKILYELQTKLSENNYLANSLQQEINKLKNISDVCPTCGQKLPNIIKPDTSEQEAKLLETQKQIKALTENIAQQNLFLNQSLQKNDQSFAEELKVLTEKRAKAQKILTQLKTDFSVQNTQLSNLNGKLSYVQEACNNYVIQKQTLEKNIANLKLKIDSDETELQNLTVSRLNLIERSEIIKKMESLAKRDFRGILLTNVINFIKSRAQEYCQEIFGSNELDFGLDGNNLNITYCKKSYELLSGGEKQKVDIIIQLALREMLTKYLNFSSNILVLDEIFDNLDTIGTNNVLKLINSRLTDIESIFIISHHAMELNINYDTEIKVIKNKLGVSEVFQK